MARRVPHLSLTLLLAAAACSAGTVSTGLDFEGAQNFLQTYCQSCHGGKSGAGGFAVQRLASSSTFRSDPQRWTAVARRVKNGEMPPRGAAAPTVDLREKFTVWVDQQLRTEACATGPVPGPSPVRRLNR